MSNELVTILGAGGKMGARISKNLVEAKYRLNFCEQGQAIARLAEMNLANTGIGEAIPASDVVIMAVPDVLIGKVSKEVVPLMKKGATMILLDPAAAYAKTVALRDDCTYVVSHPCHPALYKKQDSIAAYEDYFGMVSAKQDIVVALYGGDEAKYPMAERMCRDIFAPVDRAFRITVDQMILLEPAAAEVAGGSVTYFIRDVIEEVVRRGVPRDAALSFMLGHIRTVLALTLELSPGKVSDACKVAIEQNYSRIIKDDWRKIFDPDVVEKTVDGMLNSPRR